MEWLKDKGNAEFLQQGHSNPIILHAGQDERTPQQTRGGRPEELDHLEAIGLDTMMGGKGFFRGSSILISGTAGTGKTSLAAAFARAACQRGEKCLFFGFEESPAQIVRNMLSIGINLEPYVRRGLLRFHTSRPTLYGLETHLTVMHKQIEEFKPSVVIVDPVTNMMSAGVAQDVRSMLLRLMDYLKGRQITTMMTSLSSVGDAIDESVGGVSSLIDTWVFVQDIEIGGERNRGLYILKSRGMAHSNQIREFVLSNQGIVYLRRGICS